MTTIQLLKKLEVRDKDGTVTYSKESVAESFVIGFLKILEAIISESQAVTLKDKLDVTITILDSSNLIDRIMGLDAPVGEASGILCGTGTTPPTNTDIVIETLIPDGNGAGQLEMGSHSFTGTAEVGDNVELAIARPFVNASGNAITVEELAMVASVVDSSAQLKYVTIVHDLTGGVIVNNGQTLTVTYTFQTKA